MSTIHWEKKTIAFIGLGLIASSMCRALQEWAVRPYIIGTARSEATRQCAIDIGLCDQVVATNIEAVQDADIVVLSTPVGATARIMKEIGPHLKYGVILTDVGSVKASVIAMVEPYLHDGVYFVPAHPLAGTEKSGPTAGFPTLFQNRWCILTPVNSSSNNAINTIKTLWTNMGAFIEEMSPEHHDLVLSVTSHLPHLIAYTMVGVADDLSRVTEREVIKFSAAGFRDFTRIAASDPTMWRDVFLNNKTATLEMLDRFETELDWLRKAITSGDGSTLYNHFERTRAIRRSIIDLGQDVDTVDFGRVDQN